MEMNGILIRPQKNVNLRANAVIHRSKFAESMQTSYLQDARSCIYIN
jgi:hypothetical protein